MKMQEFLYVPIVNMLLMFLPGVLMVECEEQETITISIHNASSMDLYWSINDFPSKKEISTEWISGEWHLEKLLSDSTTNIRIPIIWKEKEQVSFILLFFTQDTYDKYTIDEIREKNIYDYGDQYSYKELENMQFVIKITDDMIEQGKSEDRRYGSDEHFYKTKQKSEQSSGLF